MKKPISKSDVRTNAGRRSFIWKAGAGLSTLLTVAIPGIAGAGTKEDTDLTARIDGLNGRIGILEDEKKIRTLHQNYEDYLDRGIYEEVVDLFADDGEAVFNGGIFKNKRGGVRRLYCGYFRSGLTGKRIDHIPGVLPDIGQPREIIHVMPERKSARAGFTYSMQVGAPIVSDSVLVKMARLTGGGVMKWWEGGTCDIFYVKDSTDGRWKIKRLEYMAASKAGYRPGKSYSTPISIPLFSKIFPEDPIGPDGLVANVT